MRDFLPEIDYSKLDISKIPIDKCKTGAIRLMHPEKVSEIFEREKIDIKVN